MSFEFFRRRRKTLQKIRIGTFEVHAKNIKSYKLISARELAKQAEVELKTGLELLGRDKTVQDLIALVDPPTTA
jgi:hypothetical protein